MLNSFVMARNRDPNIINTVLGSVNSHRIKSLDVYQNDQDSIDPNLMTTNTREIRRMII